MPATPLPVENQPYDIGDAYRDTPAWYLQVADHTVAAWQKVRSLCQPASCCEGEAKSGVCNEAAGCGAVGAGCAKGLQIQIIHNGKVVSGCEGCPDELRELLMKIHQVAQVPGVPFPCCDVKGCIEIQCPFAAAKKAGCDCSKGCACCETCKAKGAKAVQAPCPMLPPSAALAVGNAAAHAADVGHPERELDCAAAAIAAGRRAWWSR